jgi:hypothetical protein
VTRGFDAGDGALLREGQDTGSGAGSGGAAGRVEAAKSTGAVAREIWGDSWIRSSFRDEGRDVKGDEGSAADPPPTAAAPLPLGLPPPPLPAVPGGEAAEAAHRCRERGGVGVDGGQLGSGEGQGVLGSLSEAQERVLQLYGTAPRAIPARDLCSSELAGRVGFSSGVRGWLVPWCCAWGVECSGCRARVKVWGVG